MDFDRLPCYPRLNAASVELANGNILVSGGEDSIGIRNTEIYNYQTEKWINAQPMHVGRSYHLLVRLNSGNIIAIGGFGTRSCEIYDTTSKMWGMADSLNYERSFGETATLLNNGNVLVAGGYYLALGDIQNLNSCEIFNVNTGKWQVTDSLKLARDFHTATKLLDGRVLITGGFNRTQKTLKDCELYDPNTGKWSEAASLNIARHYHTATLLPDGKVLVTGGENDSTPAGKSCELYDPVQNKWTIVQPLLASHAYHSAILLKSGLLLLLGGGVNTNVWELYDPQNFSNVYLGNYPTDTVQVFLTNILPNGKVLTAGGETWTGTTPLYLSTNVCYLYDPEGVSGIENENNTVRNFNLFQNYPNPFNPSTRISYTIPSEEKVSIKVFDLLGTEVSELVNEVKEGGTYSVEFSGSKLASGVYFVLMTVDTKSPGRIIKSEKIVLLK